MNEIISGVFISSIHEAQNLELLLKIGITHIVNISGYQNSYPEHFQYMKINLEDEEDANISIYFSKVNRFICNGLISNGKILVHCAAGISRSPTLVIAYMIKKRKMDYYDAYKLVKLRRPCISPNLGFCTQLKFL